jgi:hypothetical protein
MKQRSPWDSSWGPERFRGWTLFASKLVVSLTPLTRSAWQASWEHIAPRLEELSVGNVLLSLPPLVGVSFL